MRARSLFLGPRAAGPQSAPVSPQPSQNALVPPPSQISPERCRSALAWLFLTVTILQICDSV